MTARPGVAAGTSAFYRLAIAAAVLLPVWLGRPGPRSRAGDVRWIALGGAFFAVDMVAYNAGDGCSRSAFGSASHSRSPAAPRSWVSTA